MEANKDIVPDYREDMCPETLKRLSRVVYMGVNPDADEEELNRKIDLIKKYLL